MLVAPLPHLSPPGSAHAIRDGQPTHPIPILLPPMPAVGSPGSSEKLGSEKSDEDTDNVMSDENATSEMESLDKNVVNDVYDI